MSDIPFPYVVPQQQVSIDDVHAIFPAVTQPTYAYTDFMGIMPISQGLARAGSGATNLSTNEMEIDAIAQCCHPKRLFVAHDQVFGSGGYNEQGTPIGIYPSLAWNITQNGDPDNCAIDNEFAPLPLGNLTMEATESAVFAGGTPDPDSYVAAYADVGVPCQGFTAFLWLYNAQQYTDGGDAGNNAAFGQYGDTNVNVPNLSIGFRIRDPNITNAEDPSDNLCMLNWMQGGGLFFNPNAELGAGGTEMFSAYTGTELRVGANRASMLNNLLGESNGIAQNYDDLYGFTPVVIDVKFIAGVVQIMVGAYDTPFVWSESRISATKPYDPYWSIDRFFFSASLFAWTAWSLHPSKFRPAADYLSSDHVLPEPFTLQPSYRIHMAPAPAAPDQQTKNKDGTVGFEPPGTTATAGFSQLPDAPATISSYFLSISNMGATGGTYFGVPYVDYTAAVRAVSAFWDGIFTLGPSNPDVYQPEEITITKRFDLSSLSIQESCSLRMNNYDGTWSNANDGGWVDNTGYKAVQIQLGILGGSGGLQTCFTGILNTEFMEEMVPGGQSYVTIQGRDCSIMCEVPIYDLPWFDGMNIYYAIFLLAQLGNISPQFIQPYLDGLIPDDPYDPCPADPTLSFYLPIGSLGTPLTRFGGGVTPWQIMRKLAYAVGFLLFFDATGVLQFYKFTPSTLPADTDIKTFTFVAQPRETGLLTEIWRGSYSGKMTDVKNAAFVIGVSALGQYWNPIFGVALDTASINDPTAPNYIGWRNQTVWSDKLFADPVFAQQAANEILSFQRWPSRYLDLTTWFQPDERVAPLDVIQIYNPKSASAYGMKNFLVLETTDRVALGQAPMTSFRGRWLPPTDPPAM